MTPLTSTAPAPVTLRSPQDLLAALPYQLGFRPAESVVLACVADRRLVLVARVGLDDLGGPDAADGLTGLRRAVRHADPDWCALVVYTDLDPATVDARTDLVRDVLDPATRVEEWHVSSTRYRGLGCTDPGCCPLDGHPVAALDSTVVGASQVLAGRAVAASARAAFEIPPVDRTARDLAARAARRWEKAGRADDDRAAWRREALATWRRALRAVGPDHGADVAPDRLGAALAGRVAAALADRQVRDAALLTLVPGHDASARRTLEHDDPAAVEEATARAMAAVTDPAVAVRPDPRTAARARAVLEQTVAHVPRRRQAAPLTVLAFLAWWEGDGPRAAHRVTAALAVDPGYRLARLVESVVGAGLPPGWVRAGRPGGAAGPTPDGQVG
ncbi:uncharacterized protein DUF4192 [Isoptericola jiangsuensis]|uniref:Uncharacterized protein DUF4192 n=1 Tax=Isoptericola jiangsuensis TaxID=548579 RepID=A0A2A9EX73_9MICO|nr:DUF4192 domain-containing protein [Isoptericola jiangsuensis]PFG43478.1 uncharacterized protein DUF4192 [Isoptericola jiangsuensis]